jgi:lipopolysaccharide/colanic/teichoic acid biosynthesis glycosyltransferase
MNRFYANWIKSGLDRAAALVGMVVLAPLFVGIALLVRTLLGAPVLFCQVRPGLCGRPFRLWKFRTMTDARDPQGRLLPDEVRLTRFGRWLRSTSLDELPELWNIVRGEMSFVGPRPLLMEYLLHYTDEQRRRHDVRPGLTGLAQINGRNQTSWDERFRHDLSYVEHVSLWLDLKILFQTFGRVLRRDGVSAEGHATMPRFDELQRRSAA